MPRRGSRRLRPQGGSVVSEPVEEPDVDHEINAFLGEDEVELDAEERQAEEDGVDLYQNDEGFVAGQMDSAREAEAFAAMGITNFDEYDGDLLDNENSYDVDPAAVRRATRQLDYEQRQRGEDKSRKLVDDWLKGMGDTSDDEVVAERLRRRKEQRQAYLEPGRQPTLNLQVLEEALNVIREQVPTPGAVTPRESEALNACFSFFLHSFTLDESMDNDEQNELKPESEHPHTYIPPCPAVDETLAKEPFYLNQIDQMITRDKTTLLISVKHMLQHKLEDFVLWLEHVPEDVLRGMNEVLTNIVVSEFEGGAELYTRRTLVVRLKDWIRSRPLRSLRSADLNCLIKIGGVVTRRSAARIRLRALYVACATCGASRSEAPIIFNDGTKPQMPRRCENCLRTQFVVDRIRTLYNDTQRITVQESPSETPPGRAPRQRSVLLSGDIVDAVKPGEEVYVIGLYQTRYDVLLNIHQGFPVLGTEIVANYVGRREIDDFAEITTEDIAEIQKLSKDPQIRERIIASMAPALWGFKDAKTAIAYALFSGVAKGHLEGSSNSPIGGGTSKLDTGLGQTGHSIRGDINVLLIGDPGLGKSQALQFVRTVFDRTVSTTGKGVSSVGLTAGVRRDTGTGEWVLEGGALVLADEGICLIDEFDKMSDKDRVSLHEALEQQQISISKVGIVATLRARCSVIAAANPKFGRYEPSLTFKENVALGDPILSRFDIVVVLRDQPNPDLDQYLAEYVLTNHQINHPNLEFVESKDTYRGGLHEYLRGYQSVTPINPNLLKKYIYYARTRCAPAIPTGQAAIPIQEKLSWAYTAIRQKAARYGGLPMTLRHVESLLRVSEANAKMRLATRVTEHDVELAIATILHSFISSQKHAVAQRLTNEFSRFVALAKGIPETLTEIIRRIAHQNYQRTKLRERKSENVDPFNEATFDVGIAEFLEAAQREKFSDYAIEQYLKSAFFQDQFQISDQSIKPLSFQTQLATHAIANQTRAIRIS